MIQSRPIFWAGSLPEAMSARTRRGVTWRIWAASLLVSIYMNRLPSSSSRVCSQESVLNLGECSSSCHTSFRPRRVWDTPKNTPAGPSIIQLVGCVAFPNALLFPHGSAGTGEGRATPRYRRGAGGRRACIMVAKGVGRIASMETVEGELIDSQEHRKCGNSVNEPAWRVRLLVPVKRRGRE